MVGYKSEENESEKGDETPGSLDDPGMFTNLLKRRSSKVAASQRLTSGPGNRGSSYHTADS